MPSKELQDLLDGAEKFALKYQRETFAVTRVGYQQVKGWWKGPLETKEQFQGRFQRATRAFAWEITIRLKDGIGWPGVQLSHSDFAYVPGTGKLVSSIRYGSTETRNNLISRHEDCGKVGLVTLFHVEIAPGVAPLYFTRVRSIALEDIMGPSAYDTEKALVKCQVLL